MHALAALEPDVRDMTEVSDTLPIQTLGLLPPDANNSVLNFSLIFPVVFSGALF